MGYNEADTMRFLIEPQLTAAGWVLNNPKADFHARFEYQIRDKRYLVEGEKTSIQPNSILHADYVLFYKNKEVAVIEAEPETKSLYTTGHGIEQAEEYAKLLNVPLGIAANGKEIMFYNRVTKERTAQAQMPTPAEVWQLYQQFRPFLPSDNLNPLLYPECPLPNKETRSYQRLAINSVIEAFLRKQPKALLTMATGTGKTYVSFQITWKLIKSNYLQRVLFLSDRVNLRDQAFDENFAPFENDRYRLVNGTFSPNHKIYFSTYQTLTPALLQQIPPDFFDLIIIDECHRSIYGDWQEILKWFGSARVLGMTATPKQSDNINTYEFFGEPVYRHYNLETKKEEFGYSLASGIEDGYLATYKIYRCLTNVDENGLATKDVGKFYADELYAEEITPDKIEKDIFYTEDFEKIIRVPARLNALCDKFLEMLQQTNPHAKSIIYCASMEHADKVRAYLNHKMQNEDFCARIVSEEQDQLAKFRNGENSYPQIATTVDLLSTGTDIPSLENIVFMRAVESPVLFKQIIGRGARLTPQKHFFRIIDFTNATHLIDGNWDVPTSLTQPEEPLAPFTQTITGEVFDQTTKLPLANVRVHSSVGRWRSPAVLSNQYGRFELIKLPQNERLHCSFFLADYLPLEKNVKPKSNSDLRFFLSQRQLPTKITAAGVAVTFGEITEIDYRQEKIDRETYRRLFREFITEQYPDLGAFQETWFNPELCRIFRQKLEKEAGFDLEALRFSGHFDEYDNYMMIAFLVYDAPLLSNADVANYLKNVCVERWQSQIGQMPALVALFDLIVEKYQKDGVTVLTPDLFTTPDLLALNALNLLTQSGLTALVLLDFLKERVQNLHQKKIGAEEQRQKKSQ